MTEKKYITDREIVLEEEIRSLKNKLSDNSDELTKYRNTEETIKNLQLNIAELKKKVFK